MIKIELKKIMIEYYTCWLSIRKARSI